MVFKSSWRVRPENLSFFWFYSLSCFALCYCRVSRTVGSARTPAGTSSLLIAVGSLSWIFPKFHVTENSLGVTHLSFIILSTGVHFSFLFFSTERMRSSSNQRLRGRQLNSPLRWVNPTNVSPKWRLRRPRKREGNKWPDLRNKTKQELQTQRSRERERVQSGTGNRVEGVHVPGSLNVPLRFLT